VGGTIAGTLARARPHFAAIVVLGVSLLLFGLALGFDVGGVGSRLVRASIGSRRHRQGKEVRSREIRFFSVGWGLVCGVVGVGWMLIGFRVLT
jgi:hypothetical protein